MSIIERIVLFFKNIFNKNEKTKELEEPKKIIDENENTSFIESLKFSPKGSPKNKKIETLTCEGDGLGIQKKMTY